MRMSLLSPIIRAEELYKRITGQMDGERKQQITASTLAIVDCRFWLMEPERGQEAYKEGHIPGAVYFDLDRDLSSPKAEHGGRHPLPQPQVLAQRLTEAGITHESVVVAYDAQGGANASRLWWLLQWLGHEGEVLLLDGGIQAWEQEGYPLEQEEVGSVFDNRLAGVVSSKETSIYTPRVRDHLVASMEEVASKLGNPRVRLIDSRESPRYRGEVEPIDPKAGHIPGAVNTFWQQSLDEAGRWRSAAEQQARWSSIVGDADEVIVYCGSGVTACPNVLALWQAGYTNAKLYAGSWSDWISYSENPIATGEE